MTREEFYEWLDSCPSSEWEVITDDFGETKILFNYEEKYLWTHFL